MERYVLKTTKASDQAMVLCLWSFGQTRRFLAPAVPTSRNLNKDHLAHIIYRPNLFVHCGEDTGGPTLLSSVISFPVIRLFTVTKTNIIRSPSHLNSPFNAEALLACDLWVTDGGPILLSNQLSPYEHISWCFRDMSSNKLTSGLINWLILLFQPINQSVL